MQYFPPDNLPLVARNEMILHRGHTGLFASLRIDAGRCAEGLKDDFVPPSLRTQRRGYALNIRCWEFDVQRSVFKN